MLAELKLTQQELHTKHKTYTPLVVKISPDLSRYELENIARAIIEHGIDGIITNNTSVYRYNIPNNVKHVTQKGGLSGKPLCAVNVKNLDILSTIIQNHAAIIACGGISSAQDVTDRLNAGADLVQVYTAFIYQGMSFISKLVNSLYNDHK